MLFISAMKKLQIKDFFERDQKQTFNLCPKLTRDHIHLPMFSRMKVKYATLVSSKSLAAGLATHSKLLGKRANNTAKFLSHFEYIFDVMNSSRLSSAKVLNSAISDNNKHIDFRNDSIYWLSSLKIMAD